MAKSKKKGRTILVLVTLLILLILAYVVVLKKKDNNSKEDKVTVASIESSKITEITYLCNNEKVTLVKDQDTWVDKTDTKAPVNQQKVNAMLTIMSKLEAESTVTKDLTQLGEYGLEKPKVEITIQSEDGSKTELALGERTATGNGYYAICKGQDVIYVLPTNVYTAFSFSRTQLLTMQEFPKLDSSKIMSIHITEGKKERFHADCDESALNSTQEPTWYIKKPYHSVMQGDSNKLKSYFENFKTVFINEVVEYDCKDLSVYGLDQPSATVDLTYYAIPSNSSTDASSTTESDTTEENKKNSLTIKIGKKADDNYYYIQLLGTERESENVVYTMPINMLTPIVEVKPFDYLIPYVQFVSLSTLNKLTVTVDGKTYQFESKGKEDSKKYYFNGKEANADNFKALYQTIIGVSAAGEIDKKITDNKSVYEFDFVMNDKSLENLHITYLPYDDINYYRVNINGSEEFVVDKTSVDKLVKIITEYTGE